MAGYERREVFEKLHQAFLRDVVPVIEVAEFQPSVFSAHHFGREGRDAIYTFVSLSEAKVLDLLCFFVSYKNMAIGVRYNRFALDRDVLDLSEFEGKTGLPLFLMPLRSTEMRVHRWVPIPFLHIPKLYAVKRPKGVKKSVDKSIARVVADLAGDIEYFEIIRADWDELYEPNLIKVSELE